MSNRQIEEYNVVEKSNVEKKGADVSISKGDEKLIECFVPLKSGSFNGQFDGYELSECSKMSEEQIGDLYIQLQESIKNSTSSPTWITFSAIQCYLVQHLGFDIDSEIVKKFGELSHKQFRRWVDTIDWNFFTEPKIKKKEI